jgi:F-type H+-transporting ATPase subunit beta
MDNKKINRGQIRAIRGSVVDAFFPQLLPKINHQLKSGEAIIEVTLLLDANTIREIALTPTQGLKRGDEIIDMGHPLQVPVGREA